MPDQADNSGVRKDEERQSPSGGIDLGPPAVPASERNSNKEHDGGHPQPPSIATSKWEYYDGQEEFCGTRLWPETKGKNAFKNPYERRDVLLRVTKDIINDKVHLPNANELLRFNPRAGDIYPSLMIAAKLILAKVDKLQVDWARNLEINGSRYPVTRKLDSCPRIF